MTSRFRSVFLRAFFLGWWWWWWWWWWYEPYLTLLFATRLFAALAHPLQLTAPRWPLRTAHGISVLASRQWALRWARKKGRGCPPDRFYGRVGSAFWPSILLSRADCSCVKRRRGGGVFGTWEARARRLAVRAYSILGAGKEGCEGLGSGEREVGRCRGGWWLWLVRCDVACMNHDGGNKAAFRNTIRS